MTELLSFFQSYFINQTFLITLLIITLNNVNKSIEIKNPIQVIRYVLIIAGLIALIQFVYYLFFELASKESMLYFIKRATAPYRYFYISSLAYSIIIPFFLILKKFGTNKHFILIVSFLISLGYWYERFVIYVTSNHRGHLDEGMNLQINSYSIRVAIIITLLTINLFLFIQKKSKIDTDKSEIDSELIE